MKDILQKNDRVIVEGELPGTGKTTAIKNSVYIRQRERDIKYPDGAGAL